MYLTKDQVKTALSSSIKKCDELNVAFRNNDLSFFKTTLASIEEAKKYTPGEQIDTEHLKLISDLANTLIKDMANNLIENKNKNTELKNNINPLKIVMAAADYLYLLTMNKLGCPDIPPVFDENVRKTVETSAINIHKAYVEYGMSKSNSFKEQRGKNADELRNNGFDTLITTVGKNTATARQVGNLIAEYQALTERQSRHGAIWRFFHSKENEKRTTLINDMKNALNTRLKSKINIDTANPTEVSRMLADINIQGSLDNAVNERFLNAEKAFGLNAEEDRQRLNEIDSFNLFNDVNDKSEIKEVKPLIKKSDDIPIINNNTNEFSVL